MVVIGAGLAGLAAARQLQVRTHCHTTALQVVSQTASAQAMGHQVVVVEGRSRAGGRVHSSRLEEGHNGVAVGELGGSVLTGVDGNPLAVLARQLGETMHTVGMR